jgi:HD superfamily phosphohydrolase YqeK
MNNEQYGKDKDFVIHLHDIARQYDSNFLHKVADRMDALIEENRENERKVTRLEIVG